MAPLRNNKRVLAIIGARSGSTQIPDKNIRNFFGKPLMAWIIEAAKNSYHIERVLVSTDSQHYATIAKKYGAEIPFLRPIEISGNGSTDYEYIKHTLDWLREHEQYIPDYFVRLLPTTPLQQTADIDNAINELISNPILESVMVVAEARQHPEKSLMIVNDADGSKFLKKYIDDSDGDISPKPRQLYKKAYFRGNVVVSRREVIDVYKNIAGNRVGCIVIDANRAIDIDDWIDFHTAEVVYQSLNSANK